MGRFSEEGEIFGVRRSGRFSEEGYDFGGGGGLRRRGAFSEKGGLSEEKVVF